VIEHVVRLSRPESRSLFVEVRTELPAGTESQLLAFPTWTPGSYLVREHQRHVHDFAVTVDGKPARWTKADKHRYRVETAGGRRLVATFEVYAHELTVRTSHVDASHAFLNPVSFAPWLPGREHEPQRLTLSELPPGWGVACALEESAPGTLEAPDYDALIDSPLECGPHARPEARLRFSAHGVPHEVVVWGRGLPAPERLASDLARLADSQGKLFGGLPYPRYLFILHLTGQGRGGLEHRDSSALLFPRGLLAKPKGYEDLLALASHELFHAWNVKRIKPAAFTPYDLGREAPTRLLWAFEGLTSYYEDIALVRAGLLAPSRFLEILGERLTTLARNPGRRRHPVAEASFDAWIRYYRQDENSEESSVSYYLKGSLVGALLDLELRRGSNGARSLDDVMRLLWAEYGRTGVGVPEDGVERAIEQVAGRSMQALFALAIHGTEELPLAEALASHGLELRRRTATGADDKGGAGGSGTAARCDPGLVVRAEGDKVRVALVRRGGAAERGGVAPGDELVAIDGLKAEPATAWLRLHDRPAFEAASLHVFRRDELLALNIVPGEAQEDTVFVTVDEHATEGQAALRRAWLGE
jgi:predicted metalloprotease with PDZ domain